MASFQFDHALVDLAPNPSVVDIHGLGSRSDTGHSEGSGALARDTDPLSSHVPGLEWEAAHLGTLEFPQAIRTTGPDLDCMGHGDACRWDGLFEDTLVDDTSPVDKVDSEPPLSFGEFPKRHQPNGWFHQTRDSQVFDSGPGQ